MRILIGEEEVSFSPLELRSMYIGEGLEGKVFRYGDKALKIYAEECEKSRLEEETASKLIGIPTKRILLPGELIRDPESLKFRGYVTQFISSRSKLEIPEMNMGKFLDEVSILEDDILMLSDRNVELYDFTWDNFLYNGSIYFCDPGGFSFNEDAYFEHIYATNTFYFNEFVLETILGTVWGCNGKKRNRYNKSYDWNKRLSLQMKKNIRSKENVKQHVKRMAR